MTFSHFVCVLFKLNNGGKKCFHLINFLFVELFTVYQTVVYTLRQNLSILIRSYPFRFETQIIKLLSINATMSTIHFRRKTQTLSTHYTYKVKNDNQITKSSISNGILAIRENKNHKSVWY